jgi:putative endonuclease
MLSYWTYILRCSDGSYYTGVTDDITYRVDQHNTGKNKAAYTFKRRPVTLVYSAEFSDVYEAIHWEKVLKRWSRAKKEALIQQSWNALHQLALCHNATNTLTYIGQMRATFHREMKQQALSC